MNAPIETEPTKKSRTTKAKTIEVKTMTQQERQMARANVEMFQDVQDMRMRYANKLRAIVTGKKVAVEGIDIPEEDEIDNEVLAESEFFVDARILKQFKDLEALMLKQATGATEGVPIIETMIQVPGIGRNLATQLYSRLDIHRAYSSSSFIKIAGLAVKNGRADYYEKGKKAEFSKPLKKLMFNVAVCTAERNKNEGYRKIYDQAKADGLLKIGKDGKPWSKQHARLHAIRIVSQVFLSHLYEEWCKLEGTKPKEPYVFAHMGHVHKITPQECGWPESGPVVYDVDTRRGNANG